MQPEQRLLMVMADESIKLVVFLLLDLVFVPRPNCLHRVQAFGVQFNGEGHEAGIPLDDPLHSGRLREVLGVVFEFERDLRAARQIGGGCKLIAAHALACPLPALFFRDK